MEVVASGGVVYGVPADPCFRQILLDREPTIFPQSHSMDIEDRMQETRAGQTS